MKSDVVNDTQCNGPASFGAYVNGTLGPYVHGVRDKAQRCSASRCSGHGGASRSAPASATRAPQRGEWRGLMAEVSGGAGATRAGRARAAACLLCEFYFCSFQGFADWPEL
jgi:hypothetical protein